ncbi:hypothetical protein P0Y35_04030 [Kiritimatiellaeota bacterium B1221]|nr:hypothetical protein [Kiritimatiellaeota bacterium B1221]
MSCKPVSLLAGLLVHKESCESPRRILQVTQAGRILDRELIQELWSGYGRIERVFLEGGNRPSVVVKDMEPPQRAVHPRGWRGSRSHSRKLKSYQVEMAW